MMDNGKFKARRRKKNAAPADEKTPRNKRLTALITALVLLLVLVIGGTVAWLSASHGPIVNTFTPSNVTCQVTENFNGTVKSNVNVQNTGDTEAYIRVKLVTYRTNDQGQHIGGTATLPEFTAGTNWVEYNGYYYYTKPVAANQKPGTDLIGSITLTSSYEDADGGHQSIDVMAEAIQSGPEAAVKAAWGQNFSISSDGSLNVPSN